jgi:hypothetical protein
MKIRFSAGDGGVTILPYYHRQTRPAFTAVKRPYLFERPDGIPRAGRFPQPVYGPDFHFRLENGCFPVLCRRGLYVRFFGQKPDSMLPVVFGQVDELVKHDCFIFPACPAVLPFDFPRYRFLFTHL